MEIALVHRLSILSHPQRMAIFRLLMRRYPNALPAGEITQVLNLKASTASQYLSALMNVQLILQERRGTTLLYRMNLEAARAVIADFFVDCCRGRPDLCEPFFDYPRSRFTQTSGQKHNVLFICTGNSARSIFAEAIMRHEARDRFNVYSAGSHHQSEINPHAIEILENHGIETAGLRSKNTSEFRAGDAPTMDFVFTVCDLAANEDCPPWSGQPVSAHWSLPDPAKASGNASEKRLAFQQSFGAISIRINAFTALPVEALDRVSLQYKVDEIGKMMGMQ